MSSLRARLASLGEARGIIQGWDDATFPPRLGSFTFLDVDAERHPADGRIVLLCALAIATREAFERLADSPEPSEATGRERRGEREAILARRSLTLAEEACHPEPERPGALLAQATVALALAEWDEAGRPLANDPAHQLANTVLLRLLASAMDGSWPRQNSAS